MALSCKCNVETTVRGTWLMVGTVWLEVSFLHAQLCSGQMARIAGLHIP